MSRLPLSLSNRIPVIVVAAGVVFRLHLEGGCHGDKDVDIVVDNKVLLGETNKDNDLDCSSCNQSKQNREIRTH